MIPTLDLPRESLVEPKRLDLATLAHLMLWPDDQAMRDRAMNVWRIEEGRRLVREMALSTDQILELIDQAWRTETREDLQERRSYAEGLSVGTILFRALAHRNIEGDHGSIGKSIDALSKVFWRKERLQGKTFHNRVLPRLRCVSHLWAAFIAARLNGQLDFPCRVSGLPTFLARAETYRKQAEATSTPHSPRPLLLPGEAVTIPHLELLPESDDLKFAPVSDLSRMA